MAANVGSELGEIDVYFHHRNQIGTRIACLHRRLL
jgi:hypothetical protein